MTQKVAVFDFDGVLSRLTPFERATFAKTLRRNDVDVYINTARPRFLLGRVLRCARQMQVPREKVYGRPNVSLHGIRHYKIKALREIRRRASDASDATAVLLIDDRASNVEAAARAGFSTYMIETRVGLRMEDLFAIVRFFVDR